MLEPNSPQKSPFSDRPAPPPLASFAKWPPDDGDSGTGHGAPAGGGGGFDPGDGNFKKGRLNPIIALLVLLVLGAIGGAFALFGAQKDAEHLSADRAAEEKKRILTLSQMEQMTAWRELASGDKSKYLQEEALKNLAWLGDPAGVDLAITALKDQEQTVRAQAATALAEYGLPAAEKAKGPLLEALKEAAPESRPQIAWALATLKESSVFPEVMTLYRSGQLTHVQKLGGASAFDPNKLVALVSLDQLAAMAGDDSSAVRQLVATVLSRNADKKYTNELIALLKNADGDVSRQAAPGLGKIGDATATAPLVEKLHNADPDGRKAYLAALRDGIGTSGLVMALSMTTDEDKTKAWNQTDQVFKMIHSLADPRGGDALTKYMATASHIHWQFEAALALAEIGDLRAVPTLAARLRMDEQKIYSDDTDYEMMLKRDNKERIVAARMLADLAQLYPSKHEQIRSEAEDALIFWLHERLEPHANGLRALAAMESTKDLPALRSWSDPSKPFPLRGQPPPVPQEWEIAQSALRYVGLMKDQSSWSVLEKMLKRRPADLDVTMDAMAGGGVAMLGMTLRAIGVGAAQGFAEWGDPKAFKPLLDYIEEPKENEQSRMAACESLAWVARDEDMITVAEKIGQYSGTDKRDQFRRTCLLETLITRPITGTSEALLTLLVPEASMDVRHQAARAIGKAGLTDKVEASLFEKIKDERLMTDAALALGLGGKPDVAARALAMLAGQPKAVVDDLQELWYRSFGYWSLDDLEKGHLFRFVDNAEAMSRVEFGDTAQGWANQQLERQFDNLEFDNGPHSFTRVVLRNKLMQMAISDDDAKRSAAIRVLKFMHEQGVLLALRDTAGRTGELAAAAYYELMHPLNAEGVKNFSEEAQK